MAFNAAFGLCAPRSAYGHPAVLKHSWSLLSEFVLIAHVTVCPCRITGFSVDCPCDDSASFGGCGMSGVAALYKSGRPD